MIKVVIAEDKPLILRSIRQKIESYGAELQIVGEALNGADALLLVGEFRPDIVFTDIRMPVMDGLQLISNAKTIVPDAQFVIISGHDEFDYARQAMKLNVQEYLLKPVDTEELRHILKRLTETVMGRNRENEQRFLESAIHSNSHSLAERSRDLGYPYYLVILMQAGPHSNFMIDYANPFHGFWSGVNTQEWFQSLLGPDETCWLVDGKTFNEQVVVVGCRHCSDRRMEQLAACVEKAFSAFDIPIAVAMSEFIPRIDHLGIKFQVLRASLRKHSVFGQSSVWVPQHLNLFAETDAPILDPSVEKTLTLLIRAEKKEQFLEEVHKLFERWESSGTVTQFHLENMIKQVLQIGQKAVYGRVPITGNLEMEADEVLSISKDYHTLFQGLAYVFDAFFPKSSRNKNHPTMVETARKVESFINEHYQSLLTIHDIAKMVNFHPGYLSKMFKQVIGVSPMEYLTNLRIRKSQELMRTRPDLSLKDIAEFVGYSNPFYFSRIFKAATGKSPSEYKDQLPGSRDGNATTSPQG